jgi:HNH endonuclease
VGRTNRPDDVFRSINTHGNDPNVCWEWVGTTGGRDHRGYIAIEGRKYLAHRVVFELFYPGVLQPKQVVRHKCDNPICCNPFHLEPGSRGDNESDKYAHDRQGYPKDVVLEIRRLAQFDMSDAKIVAWIKNKYDLKVSRSGVQKVKAGDRRAVT